MGRRLAQDDVAQFFFDPSSAPPDTGRLQSGRSVLTASDGKESSMRISALCFLVASISALAVGCRSEEPGSSTITGTIDQASFPVVIEKIDIISDSSAPTSAT